MKNNAFLVEFTQGQWGTPIKWFTFNKKALLFHQNILKYSFMFCLNILFEQFVIFNDSVWNQFFKLLIKWHLGLVWEDPLEKGTATHSSILAWRIPWTEESLVGYSPWGHKELDTTERLPLIHSLLNDMKWNFPGGPTVKTVPPLQGAWVWPLVEELRSHMLHGWPKKKKKGDIWGKVLMEVGRSGICP